MQDTEAPYQLTLTLTDQTPTRIGVNALLDLSNIQAALPEALADTSFTDGCNVEIALDTVDAVADGQEISIQGRFEMDTFKCDRALGQTPERQEKTATYALSFSTSASAIVKDQCVFFKLSNLDLTLADQNLVSDDVKIILQDARAIFLKAGDAILRKTPVCPKTPPELASLSPKYDSGGTVEIGNGGIGVALTGSIDVSTKTIVSVLKVLQSEGVLPPAR
ncbi:hypothetical protein [Ruegeria sp. Ofav3-42]|uniref:hypothetical protein n=1 Tax=Ruegeria sp. Ofav3-42 TaxID=2917759 RepID=UPI001EF52FA9|nr:hypothetical protein [Ruegeria sp. Ofav3-42]MCG7522092.1 hypothetical protein [Ruegeria sp. Ofav3-42]